MEISRETKGAFDITIAPLANAWGFGFKKGAFPDSLMIDSLLQITDYEKVKLENGRVIKQDPRIMLSCSAVAKGYSVDVIAQLLDRKGIKNYMVDIGGEVVVKGVNPKNNLWRIGINKPIDDSLSVRQDLQTVLDSPTSVWLPPATIVTFTIKTEKNTLIRLTPEQVIRCNTISYLPQ